MGAITFLIILGIFGFVVWFLWRIVTDVRDSETDTIYISASGRRVSRMQNRQVIQENNSRRACHLAAPLVYQEKKEKIA